MAEKSTRYTVVGAGNGGKAMAAHLALMGFTVSLYNRSPEHIAEIKSRGGIDLLDKDPAGPSGFGKLALVTSDIELALLDRDVIMVVTPAFAHRGLAKLMAPHLVSGQMVILHPGRTLGAYEFHKTLRDYGGNPDVIVAEAQTFIYASRSEGPSVAKIYGIKDCVHLAALPASQTRRVLAAINPAYPQFVDGGDILHTGLNNIGAIFHPAISLLNAGWIECTKGEFQFYVDGVTPTVARAMEVMDRERITVARSMGVQAITVLEWLEMSYGAVGKNLYEAIHNQAGYRGISAPATLFHRYITEDVPMSLVPIASLGKYFGVAVDCMESIIRLACVAHGTNYWRRGRTFENLGIDLMSLGELKDYVTGVKRQDVIHASTRPQRGVPIYPLTEKAYPRNSQYTLSGMP